MHYRTHYFVRGSIYKDRHTVLFDGYCRDDAEKVALQLEKQKYHNVHINSLQEFCDYCDVCCGEEN